MGEPLLLVGVEVGAVVGGAAGRLCLQRLRADRLARVAGLTPTEHVRVKPVDRGSQPALQVGRGLVSDKLREVFGLQNRDYYQFGLKQGDRSFGDVRICQGAPAGAAEIEDLRIYAAGRQLP